MASTLAGLGRADDRAVRSQPARGRGERRVAHRVPCRVRVRHAADGRKLAVVGQTVNLSANGLAVQLGRALEHGVAVEVLLPHLDGEPTRLHGRVVHSRRVLSGTFEIGIRLEPGAAAP